MAFIDRFTGTNSDPWDSTKWPTTGDSGGTTNTYDIQGNEGHSYIVGGVDDYNSFVSSSGQVQDGDITILIDPDSSNHNQWLYLCFRSSGEIGGSAAGRPATAYYYRVHLGSSQTGSTDLWYRRISDSESATLATGSASQRSTGGRFYVRAQVEDSGSDTILRSKEWNEGDQEASSWDIEYTDTSPGALHGATGVMQLVHRLYQSSNNSEIHIDNLVFNDMTATGYVKQVSGYMGADPATTVTVSTSQGQPSLWTTPTSGNTLIALLVSGTTISSFSGWTQEYSAGTGPYRYVYTKTSAGTESTITATFGASEDHMMAVYEVVGDVVFDVAAGANGSSTTSVASGSTGTLAKANSVAFAMGHHWSVDNHTDFDSDFYKDGDYDSGGESWLYFNGFAKKYLEATTALNVTASWSSSVSGQSMVAVYSLVTATKVWNGSSWITGVPKVWNGSSWITGVPKVWNGSSWVP